ncbi:MAG: PAS domain-containing protein [Solirubrobacteraceae bacterium]
MATIENEREFGIAELFFSTTDSKGIIESGNDVFARVAAYDEADMIGKPHSLIRHPDMPRCVFKLLWDTLAEGQAIAAYVKNRANTGEPYWVMATITPCEGGFLSVRLKPSTAYLDTAKAVYPELRALELELGGEREIERKRAMAASGERLLEILAGAGFPDYASFMNAALAGELASRAAQLPPVLTSQRQAVGNTPLVSIQAGCTSVSQFLDGLFGSGLDGHAKLTELSRELGTKSGFVLELAESLRLFSLNALLASSRLGSDGVVLHTVAGIMRRSSDSMRSLISDLSNDLEGADGFLSEVGFRVSVAKLQSQMASVFVEKLMLDQRSSAHEIDSWSRRLRDVARLAGCLEEAFGQLCVALEGLGTHLRGVANSVARLTHDLRVMGALESNGRIEAARTDGAAAIVLLFAEINKQIGTATVQLSEFAAITAFGRAAVSRSTIDRLSDDLERIRHYTDKLAA